MALENFETKFSFNLVGTFSSTYLHLLNLRSWNGSNKAQSDIYISLQNFNGQSWKAEKLDQNKSSKFFNIYTSRYKNMTVHDTYSGILD